MERENARLKKLLAERELNIEVLKEINAKKMVGPPARREQVNLACERGLSQRRACGLLGVSRSSLSDALRMPAKDASVMMAMKTLSAQYSRYGYRRIRIILRRQGFKLSRSRTHRLWRQSGLRVPRKRPRRRVATGRPRAFTPFKAHTVWPYDFVFDITVGHLEKPSPSLAL